MHPPHDWGRSRETGVTIWGGAVVDRFGLGKSWQFVVRVGEYGGFMLVESTDAAALHRLATTFPAFEFRVDQVLDINDAVAAELEAISWRDGLKLA